MTYTTLDNAAVMLIRKLLSNRYTAVITRKENTYIIIIRNVQLTEVMRFTLISNEEKDYHDEMEYTTADTTTASR